MNIDPIVAELAKSPVYVAPGASESATVHDDLTQLLTGKDGIHIVLLPTDSTDSLSATAAAVEKQQPAGTTLIVARGDNVAVVSNSIPAGTTEAILTRAGNVSSNGVDTIRTFVGNLHDWQAAHPDMVASQGQPDNPGFLQPVTIGVGSVVLAVVLVGVIVLTRVNKSRKLSSRVSADLPRDLRPLVIELMTVRAKIKGSYMREAIENLCEYTEGYVQRVNDGAGRAALRSQLSDAKQIVTTYLDMEKSPKYYESPATMKSQGEKAIEGLADSVLSSVRRGNSKALFDYQMNSKLLSAQRFR